MRTRRSPRNQEILWRMLGRQIDPDPIKHVRALVQALEEHLCQEAHEKNVSPEILCPCYTDQLAKAKKYLELRDRA